MNEPTHFDQSGAARLVDISAKSVTDREASASAIVWLSPEAAEVAQRGYGKKGDVLAVARLAGIMATKWTATLIPLCHPILIDAVQIDFQWLAANPSMSEPGSFSPTNSLPAGVSARCPLRCLATVATAGRTGVEMEALTAVTVTALTVIDMLKSVDREIVIDAVRLESKRGGKSGDFQRTT